MRTAEVEQAPGFRPLYAQIRELVMNRLASGQWAPGTLLPAEPRLAQELGVSQGTVRKALDELAAQNLLVRRQGKGTYVASYTPDRALFHFFQIVGDDGVRALPGSRLVSRRTGTATREERDHLGLAAGAPVLRIVRVRELERKPVLVERITVASALFPGLVETPREQIPNTLYALYERAYGVSVTRAVEQLRAVVADAEDARLLGLAPGAPLLQIERTAYGHAGNPVERRCSRCDTRRHHYLNTLE